MDRGAWGATVHEVTKSWTRLSDQHHAFTAAVTFPELPPSHLPCPRGGLLGILQSPAQGSLLFAPEVSGLVQEETAPASEPLRAS